ncbi:putative glycosyltransferase [hydrothermal vent metagenome]|uniref:Putative glycosyltransferase n=1 Tax=hydrothermal vent metagenome TaxID=652676 RepID=A0A1W1C513_9ZZZZ
MSVYKGDRFAYIVEALESMYAQEKVADIFIQKDGPVPQDISEYIEQEYRAGRIVYVGERNENRGLAFSLNQLLEIVLKRDYHYIARMDADDIALASRMQWQYKYMLEHPDVDVVGGFIEEFSNDIAYEKAVHYPLNHDEMYRFFAKRVPLAHVTAFFRRSFFEKAGLYPTISPTNEDTLLWMKGFQSGCRFANIPEILVKVRVGPAFFSRRGGSRKAWSDLQDRILVIKTLGYNISSYFYAWALFMVNIAPSKLKLFLYKRLR